MIILKLTPRQARFIWDLLDAQADAGACKGGNTETEQDMIQAISEKLLAVKDQWSKR